MTSIEEKIEEIIADFEEKFLAFDLNPVAEKDAEVAKAAQRVIKGNYLRWLRSRLTEFRREVEEEAVKPYQEEISKAAKMITEAYGKGKDDEFREWRGSLTPGTIEVDLRARSEDGEEVDNLRVLLTKEQVTAGRRSIVEHFLEEAILKLATKGKVVKSWIAPTQGEGKE